MKLNLRHKAGLFLTLVAVGCGLFLECSAKRQPGFALLGIAVAWLIGTLSLRTLVVPFAILICVVGLYVAVSPRKGEDTMLGMPLVLIFVLWLIDKHAIWKTAGKFALITLGLAVVGVGSFYGWNSYRNRKSQEASGKAFVRNSRLATKDAGSTFDLNGARQAGYSDHEILEYLGVTRQLNVHEDCKEAVAKTRSKMIWPP